MNQFIQDILKTITENKMKIILATGKDLKEVGFKTDALGKELDDKVQYRVLNTVYSEILLK